MNRNLSLTIRESAMIQKAKHGAALRDFLAVFYGDQLEKVLAQEPEAAPDLDKPVTEIWVCDDKNGLGHALHAGYTIWRDFDHGHLVTNDDDLTEFEDPKQSWQRIYPVAKTESRRKLEQYLDELKASGKERTKLSEQLRQLVAEVVQAIADEVREGAEATVGGPLGTVLRRTTFHSNIGSWSTLEARVVEYPTSDAGETVEAAYVFSSQYAPGQRFYLHRDFGVSLRVAPVEVWLEVANHLPEVIHGFQIDNERVAAALRQGFEVLRKMAEE